MGWEEIFEYTAFQPSEFRGRMTYMSCRQSSYKMQCWYGNTFEIKPSMNVLIPVPESSFRLQVFTYTVYQRETNFLQSQENDLFNEQI
jgi:hypothetical protein